MVFLDVCRALYDYAPQSDEELEIKEGDLLFVLEKSADDDWWKCKKKATSDEDDEPEGLVPNNYVEKAQPAFQAKALYDYSKQTDEELSFREEARLQVYDDTDPDWTLVGLNGEYGFAPAIYIEKASGNGAAAASAPSAPAAARVLSPPPMQRDLAPPPMPSRSTAVDEPIPGEADYPDPGLGPTPSPEPATNNPAAALAGIIAQRTGGASIEREVASPPLPSRPQYTPEESEEDDAPPPMPRRPQSQHLSSPPPTQYASSRSFEPAGVQPSPPYNRQVSSSTYSPAGFTPAEDEFDDTNLRSPGGFRLYNIHEMVSHMGKNKKMPTTLGLNLAKGIIMISPEKTRDGPSQEWTAEKLTHYSIEGKHVFVELVRPSKSIDFHAGAKDTAKEIVQLLGELAGASRAEGFREILDAATKGTGAEGWKKGKMLYEFMAQGEDEVSVAVDDEVIVLDDTKSEEWWMVRRLRNGKEGVVPASYVEITGTVPRGSEAVTGLNAARSTIEQNRMEEERLAKQAAKNGTSRDSTGGIPERGSSRAHRSSDSNHATKDQSSSRSKPNPARVRTWTDRSGTFKVEAEFIGLREGKIHLHKMNGVKIAVAVAKMSIEDIEYTEKATGVSLDDDKPLSEIKRQSTIKKKDAESAAPHTNGSAGASVQRPASSGDTAAERKKRGEDEDYWFDFFLQCGVNYQICGRYASAFSRDQMTPEILPEVNEQLLRTLGLKEGDILRVMKFLDAKYGRTSTKSGGAPASPTVHPDDEIRPVNGAATGGSGGLFSGPGGALRNNTRKGRPAPAVQTNDTIDEAAFKQGEAPARREAPADARATPLTSAPERQAAGGFDDDAWDVKPARTAPAPVQETPKPAEPPRPQAQTPKLNDDLSLLAMPLQPTAAPAPAPQPAPAQAEVSVQPQQTAQQQPPLADQALFDKIAALAPPRQRPQPPATMQQPTPTGLAPPPRAASAPGFNPQQQFGPPPLQPQLTGYPQQQQLSYQQTGFQPQPLYQQPTGFAQQRPQTNGIQAMQQNFPALQPQPTGMAFQPQSQFGQAQAMQQYPQQTGYMQAQQPGFAQPSYQQALVNGQQTGSPFADPPRQPFQPVPSGLSNSFVPQQTGFQPQQTGYLPQQTGFQQQQPGFQPQQTGFPPQQTGFPQQPMAFPQQQQQQPSFNLSQPTGFPSGFPQQAPPPQLPPQQTGGVFGPSQPVTPLVPQKTGPAPPVRFGTPVANPLMPQPTGRANLAKATPQNPFGF
ncbi:hypothetical protein BAUCODRAFT_150723 [Baudoinia panamericana UAMH 10762]|uniref:Actin cytoskeleton-regulatory complex protein SLA1 n=1 Tax=Baudoinia panamericana (strain UAMH 10762) TaxID=717646 RepID=M2N332_BAUPA|nr:uncharacterized protein BAUCODRAFT_150723 [Baudoinia panamericana UAMH 10762]EMC93389.1 hypothetical protein BAUCODRAFT_150723 [Baudoinia panamericana UAMH 10762]